MSSDSAVRSESAGSSLSISIAFASTEPYSVCMSPLRSQSEKLSGHSAYLSRSPSASTQKAAEP